MLFNFPFFSLRVTDGFLLNHYKGRPKGSSAARRKNAIPIRRRPMRRTLFAEEELNLLQKMEGFNQGEDVIEVLCGCTDKKYGDTVGTLIISSTGQFIITCDCPLEHTLENKETAIGIYYERSSSSFCLRTEAPSSYTHIYYFLSYVRQPNASMINYNA